MNREFVPEERVVPSFPSPISLPLLAQHFQNSLVTLLMVERVVKLVANACRWDEPTKLVTHLKGPAFSFYRSCDLKKRNHYSTRGSPRCVFKLSRVACSITESKKLKCLFRKAYPLVQQASIETQDMFSPTNLCRDSNRI